MQKHFFAYRKWQDGQPAAQIEIVVILPSGYKRDDARRLADEEIKALADGHLVNTHDQLRAAIREFEQMRGLLPVRFVFSGSN